MISSKKLRLNHKKKEITRYTHNVGAKYECPLPRAESRSGRVKLVVEARIPPNADWVLLRALKNPVRFMVGFFPIFFFLRAVLIL